jgi:hypothetical protein
MRYRSILSRIKQDGKVDKESLAESAGTSLAMIEVLLEELIRLGYLESDALAGCTGICSGCSSGCTGAVKGLPENFWTITARGETLISSKS